MRICFEAESDTRDANLAFAGLPGRTAASDHRSPRNIRLKLRLRFQAFKGGSDGYRMAETPRGLGGMKQGRACSIGLRNGGPARPFADTHTTLYSGNFILLSSHPSTSLTLPTKAPRRLCFKRGFRRTPASASLLTALLRRKQAPMSVAGNRSEIMRLITARANSCEDRPQAWRSTITTGSSLSAPAFCRKKPASKAGFSYPSNREGSQELRIAQPP